MVRRSHTHTHSFSHTHTPTHTHAHTCTHIFTHTNALTSIYIYAASTTPLLLPLSSCLHSCRRVDKRCVRACIEFLCVTQDAPIDCLLWKKISKNYTNSVWSLDKQMRGLCVIECAARRVSKEVCTAVCCSVLQCVSGGE